MDSFDKLTITFGLRFFQFDSCRCCCQLLAIPRSICQRKRRQSSGNRRDQNEWVALQLSILCQWPQLHRQGIKFPRGLNQFSNLLCIRSNCLSSAYSDCSFTILKEKSDLAIWNVSLKHMVTKDENLNFENSKVDRKVCRIERLMMYRKCSRLGGKQCAVQRIYNTVYG